MKEAKVSEILVLISLKLIFFPSCCPNLERETLIDREKIIFGSLLLKNSSAYEINTNNSEPMVIIFYFF